MLQYCDGRPVTGNLIYRASEQSFDVVPQPKTGIASLLVNDIQIDIDEDGRLLFVWGLCSRNSWTEMALTVPTATLGQLRYIDDSIVPGASKRINSNERWPVSYDPSSRFLCIGDNVSSGEATVFAPGAIAILKTKELVALWLHPICE